MSAPDLTPDELLAAEYALSLLEGEPLLQARGRMTSDPEFAARVEWWETQLAPLLDQVGAADAVPGLWERIERMAAEDGLAHPNRDGSEVVELRRQLRFWKSTAALALAASIAAFVFALMPLQRAPTAPLSGPDGGPPLVASIPIAETPLRLAVTYIPERHQLLVSAAGISADGVHDHELWLVPPQGDPLSLGLVQPGAGRRVVLGPAVASRIGAGATLALTREPLGGKPAGRAAGPIVGSGVLSEI